MDTSMLAQRAGQWALRRARERSTWVGAAVALSSLGFRDQAAHLDHLAEILTTLGLISGVGLATASTSPHAVPAPPIGPGPSTIPTTSAISEGASLMSVLSTLRHVLGIIAVAVAPSWNKGIANALAQAEATLVPVLGDDAKRLCADLVAADEPGFVKLGKVVTDLAKIAVDKGIKADLMVLTVIAAKAYAQVKANAPQLLDLAIETGITAVAGPIAGTIASPIVEGSVAALAVSPTIAA